MTNNQSIYKILEFVNTNYLEFPESVQNQAKKMFLDLAGVFAAGTRNKSSLLMARYVSENYPNGEYTLFANGNKTNLIGAALANGVIANALDMDDGYSLLRGHPGSGFFGALLSASENANCTYGEFLSALIVGYEISIRQGYITRDYYNWDHSTGSYSTVATALSVGKLLGLSDVELEMALGISDFIMPISPSKRSCYAPSMNKDGVYWGQHTGVQAVMMAKSGITGKNPVILDDKYVKYVDSLGEKYYFFDLYIKFNSCCRWAHGPIKAVKKIINKERLLVSDIYSIDVYSFGNAATLYKDVPLCEDEAQYNIFYPIVAQILFGNCGPIESSTDKMLDCRVKDLIKKISIHYDEKFHQRFPSERLCRVEITCNNGKKFVSPECSPDGEINSEVKIADIIEKTKSINEPFSEIETINTMINSILDTSPSESFNTVFQTILNCSKESKISYKHI